MQGKKTRNWTASKVPNHGDNSSRNLNSRLLPPLVASMRKIMNHLELQDCVRYRRGALPYFLFSLTFRFRPSSLLRFLLLIFSSFLLCRSDQRIISTPDDFLGCCPLGARGGTKRSGKRMHSKKKISGFTTTNIRSAGRGTKIERENIKVGCKDEESKRERKRRINQR